MSKSIIEETVINLKKNVKDINDKLSFASKMGDNKKVIEYTRILRDMLDLIQKYDYEQKYSVYEIPARWDISYDKVISVWEQNIEGFIKNHKAFYIKGEVELKDMTSLENKLRE